MKKIQLNGPSVRNNGHYVDAGATVTVGSDPEQIESSRAKALVDTARAIVSLSVTEK